MDHLEQFKNHHFEKCWVKLVAEIDCQIQRWCWKVRSGVRTGFKSRPLFQNDAQRGLMIENQGHLFCLFGPKSWMIGYSWLLNISCSGGRSGVQGRVRREQRKDRTVQVWTWQHILWPDWSWAYCLELHISLSSIFLPQLHRRHWQDHHCEVLCWHQWFQVINGTEPPTQIVFKTQIRKKKYDENFFE